MLISSELNIIYDNSIAVQKQRNKMVKNDDGGVDTKLDVEVNVDVDEDEDDCDSGIILKTNMLVNSLLLILLK